MDPKLLRLGEKLIGTVAEEMARAHLGKRLNLEKTAELLRALKAGRLFEPALSGPLRRIVDVLNDVPAVIAKQASRQGSRLSHLFDVGNRIDANRRLYRRTLRELEAVVKDPAFRIFLNDPRNFRSADEQMRRLFHELAGTPDAFSELKAETGAFNALAMQLYPQEYTYLRIDAHHIIEGRTYDNFRQTWEMLGWTSKDDMPAMAVLYEAHIRSPRTLPGTKLANRKDLKSLTEELKNVVNLDKIKTVEQLIDAYHGYYLLSGFAPDVLLALDAIEREISIRRSQAGLIRRAKMNR